MEAKETIELLDCLFGFADASTDALADGKITLADAPDFFKPALKLPAALGGIEAVPRELKHLSSEGRIEVMAFVRKRFDLPDDTLEVLIEDTLETGWTFAENLRRLSSYRRAA